MASTDAGNGRRLLLVGWDAADWKLLTPLLDRGEMPCLNSLIDRGVMGKLSSRAPLVSPLLWTSLATGKRADKHGIATAVEADPELAILRPISGAWRRCAAIWNVLHHQGLKGHVVNWPATHPAEALDGVFVSDAYPRVAAAFGEPWPLEPGTVSPPRVEAVLAGQRVHPGELCGEQLLAFLPRLEEIDQSHDPRVVAVAAVLAQTASTHAAATWAMHNEPWDFLAIRYGGLAQLANLFLRYHPPRMENVSERDCELYREVVSAGYRFHDRMLARLLQLAGDDVTVLIVSGHGVRTGEFRPRETGARSAARWHRGVGMLCLAGPGIRRDELIHQAGILDVAPTILTLFGLPIGADMDGRPLLAAWQEPPAPPTIPSWDDIIGPRPAAAEAIPESDGQEDALAELDSLGYLDTLLPNPAYLERAVRRTSAYHLALAHRGAGHPELAVPLLQNLLDEDPSSALLTLHLAGCLYVLEDYAGSRRLLADLQENKGVIGSKEAELLSAMILISEGNPHEALTRLEFARQTQQREPLIFCFLGRAYLHLGRCAEAEDAFGKAVAIDEDCLTAHWGLALTFAQKRRWEDAADACLTVVGLDHHRHEAHYLLGVALVHLGRPARAAQAFATALSLRPEWGPARTWLATLRGREVHV